MMREIKGNRWNRRICKWIASLLTAALLVNQSSFCVLAEETGEVCFCDTRCSADGVNKACPVCVADYGKCGGKEAEEDVGMDGEPENPSAGESVDTGADTNTDNTQDTDEKTEDSDVGGGTETETEIDEEIENSDADEGVDTDADIDAILDADTDVEANILPLADEVESGIEEDVVSPASVGERFTDNKLKYRIIDEDENNLQVEVEGHEDGYRYEGDLVIPSTASYGTKKYTVTSIGADAFRYYVGLTSVIIPETVTSIMDYAYGDCSSLTNITIPSGVTSIEDHTFQHCHSLSKIVIPDNVTSIGSHALYSCFSLESITIPKGVTNIGSYAFTYCEKLASVTMLNDNISIDDIAFMNCINFSDLQIALSENITTTPAIGEKCFENCPNTRSLTFLTKDGKTRLSNTTTPTLAEAVKVYDAADGKEDGEWYGWKLPDTSDTPDVPDVTTYPVTITVNKDDIPWGGCTKTFALSVDQSTFITDLTAVSNGTYTIAVSNGTYTIYDTTGASDSDDYINTGVMVYVDNAAAQAKVNYYTVTFYMDDTIFREQIVPGNTKIGAPSDVPTKDGHTFYRWATSKDGITAFNFENPITNKTDIYASWTTDAEELFTITASAGTGGSVTPNGEIKVKSGTDQRFAITPAEGYRTASVLADGNEVLSSVQTINYARAVSVDVENNTVYYVFEKVADDHTLEAYFEATQTSGTGGGDADDTSGTGGTGGGNADDTSGAGGIGGGDTSNTSETGSSGGIANNTSGTSGSDSEDVDDNSGLNRSDDNVPNTSSDTSVDTETSVINISNAAPASKDSEPKTGDASYMEIYATIAMIAGLSYLLLYFADGKNGMTEEEKQEIVASLVKWAKKGKRIRRYAALAMIFLILVYYHSIGRRTSADWKEVYEK